MDPTFLPPPLRKVAMLLAAIGALFAAGAAADSRFRTLAAEEAQRAQVGQDVKLDDIARRLDRIERKLDRDRP